MNVMSFKEIIKQEICNGKDVSLLVVVYNTLNNMHLRPVFLFRLACFLKRKRVKLIPELIRRHLVYRYGCFMSLNAEIDIGLKLPHPNGIVIGEKVRIGRNCVIYQQVTLGGRIIGDAKAGNYPQIGDNVTIFAGAKLIGGITVGDHCMIGANSVVNDDVPPYSIAAGIPAKIVKPINPLDTTV
jgi:serine O-acetyltransferase